MPANDKSSEITARWKIHQERFQVIRHELNGRQYLAVLKNLYSPMPRVDVFLPGQMRIWSARIASRTLGAGSTDNDIHEAIEQAIAGPSGNLSAFLSAVGHASGLQGSIARQSVEAFHGSLDEADRVRLPLEGLVNLEKKRLDKAGLAEVASSFDSQAMHALRACPEATARGYEFYSASGEVGALRRQAAETYPLLAEMMATRFSIRSAIDRKESITGHIQAAFGEGNDGKPRMGKGLLKRLVGIDWPVTAHETAQAVIHALCDIPPDWFPSSETEWGAFCTVSKAVGTTLHEVTGSPAATLYTGCQGKWDAFLERIARACSDSRPPEGADENDVAYIEKNLDRKALEKAPFSKVPAMAQAMVSRMSELSPYLSPESVQHWIERVYAPDKSQEHISQSCADVRDVTAIFADKVLIPAAALQSTRHDALISGQTNEKAWQVAGDILFSGQNAPSILETSRHVHSRMAVITEAGCAIKGEVDEQEAQEVIQSQGELAALLGALPSGDEQWPPLSPIVQAPTGYYIVPLTCKALIKDEGRHMSHCVGGYTRQCLQGQSHIFSIRSLEGQRLSTFEISDVDFINRSMKVKQNRGPHNREVCAMSKASLDWWKNAIETGAIPMNIDDIRNFAMVSRGKISSIEAICGYDWHEKGNILQAMMPWGKYVPKKYRSLGVDGFMQDEQVMSVVRAIHPGYDRQMRRERSAQVEDTAPRAVI